MSKILTAFGISIVISFAITTSWFLFFGYHGLSALGGDIVALSQNSVYWLGASLFSILFFVFFAFPIALIVLKGSLKNP